MAGQFSQTKISIWVDHRFMRVREPVNNELGREKLNEF
jgi:hypothetical protein